jgi:CBS domain containing-hemolysin-like protein
MSDQVLLFIGLLLLLGNAFFVGAEFSLVSVRRSAIEPEAMNGSRSARITLHALENVSLLMAGAQLGITLCSLGLGAVAEPALAHLIEPLLHSAGISDALLHPIAFTLALGLTVYLHVVIGEMVPKNIALASPEKSALVLAPMLVGVVKVLKPVIQLLNNISLALLRLFGVHPKDEIASTYTRDEMAHLVEESRKEGYLDDDNKHILSGALTFDARSLNNIAIPMHELVFVRPDSTYEQVELIAAKTGFSRFPVREKKNSDITGYVHLKDVVAVRPEDRLKPLKKKTIRKLVTLQPDQSVRMALKVMQRTGAHIAMVGTDKKHVGLVTLEDVLEELVGEMRGVA